MLSSQIAVEGSLFHANGSHEERLISARYDLPAVAPALAIRVSNQSILFCRGEKFSKQHAKTYEKCNILRISYACLTPWAA
jgi:hypothetical protein